MVSIRYISTLLVFFVSLLLISYSSFSEEPPSQELPLEIYSNILTYDKDTDTYTAEGEAVIIRGGLKIEADKVVFDRGNMKAVATGNVVVTDEEGSAARGSRLDIDVNTGEGTMDAGNIFYEPQNLYVKGDKLIRLGKESYEIKKGRFTTCDCSPPEWSFSSSDVKVTLGEYLTSKNTFFYIKDVPVLYFPYLKIPVKRERQTGFLMPKFGYSELGGASIYNAFFWEIARNRDATFYLDYEPERGIGKGIQYRYIRKEGSEGEFFLYHFGEDDVARIREFRSIENNLGHPQNAEDDRWLFRFRHSEKLPFGINLKADIAEVSDDEYFLDFYRDPDVRSIKDRDITSLESNLTLSKGWGNFNLVTQFRYFDDLLKDNDENTLQKLPQIDLTGSSMGIPKTPLYLTLESSYIRFDRREGIDGNRIDIHPKVSLPLKPWGLFELTPQIGLRETYYWINNDEANDSKSREIYDVSVNLETTFVRIFSVDKERKLRHSIRPQLTYSYVPEIDQDDLPSFDGLDRIGKQNALSYSLTSYLTGRRLVEGERVYRDYLFFKLSQSYDINEAGRDIGPGEERRPFSAFSGELNLFPWEGISASAKADFNPYDRRLTKYITSLGLSDKRGDSFNLSYNYERDSTNYINLSVALKLTDTLHAFHRSRFSHFENPATQDKEIATLETTFGLRYQSQCWGIEITRTERPDERIIMATINLLGLGEVAHVGRVFSESEQPYIIKLRP